MGLGHKREAALSPATVIAALVAGMDRVGKRSANAPEFEVRQPVERLFDETKANGGRNPLP